MIEFEVEINSREAGVLVVDILRKHAAEAISIKKPLRVIITNKDRRSRNAEQNRRLWKAVYEQISEQAAVEGKKYDKDIWHEFFASKFLPQHEFALPFGQIVLRRKSTTELSVSEFADYMMQVEAFAASELGVVFNDERY